LQAGGQTRLVAYASIASTVFSQLIQQTDVEQTILIRLPGVRDIGIEIGILSLAWNGNLPPRYTDRGSAPFFFPARFYVIVTKTLGVFA